MKIILLILILTHYYFRRESLQHSGHFINLSSNTDINLILILTPLKYATNANKCTRCGKK